MERLLITGIDYPLGGNLALALADRFEVCGLYHQYAVESPGVRTARFEPGDRIAVEEITKEWRPKWIVHCGPLATSSWDSPPAASAVEEEPRIAAYLAELAESVGGRLTVISSDVVFAGPRMFHEETSPASSPSPRAFEVRTMERALESTGALVVRTHAYGWSPTPEGATFAQAALESLAAGIAPAVDGRRHATPILATDLAEFLLRAYELRLHGLYHLAGAERTSPWGFVTELAAVLGVHCSSLRRQPTAPAADGWHDETSLDSKRARRALEMATPLLREGLCRFAQQSHSGWRDRWTAAARHATAHELAA